MRLPTLARFRVEGIAFTSTFGLTMLILLAGAEPARAAEFQTPPASAAAGSCDALRAEAVRLAEAQQARAGAMVAAMDEGSRAVEARVAKTRRDAVAGAAVSTVTGMAAGAVSGLGLATGLLGSIAGRTRKTDDRAFKKAEVGMRHAQADFARGLPAMTRMIEVATAMQARGC